MARHDANDDEDSKGWSVSPAMEWYLELRAGAKVDLDVLEVLLDVDMKIEMIQHEGMSDNEAIERVFKWVIGERG